MLYDFVGNLQLQGISQVILEKIHTKVIKLTIPRTNLAHILTALCIYSITVTSTHHHSCFTTLSSEKLKILKS